jgi:hypothetical protein
MATEGSKTVMIGNPLRPSGPFFEAFRNPLYNCLHISAFESPNVLLGCNHIPGLATLEWIEEREKKWGKDSPSYQARVLGEFPAEDESTLISLYLAEQAYERRDEPNLVDLKAQIIMGVDVARGGDYSAIVVRRGMELLGVFKYSVADTMKVAGWVENKMREFKPSQVFIDVIGIGAGVVDRLRELGHSNAIGINVGEAPSSTETKERFQNLRAQIWWTAREWLIEGGMLTDKELVSDVSSPQIEYTSRGQVKIEPKEKIRKRLGRSPDLGDAFTLTFAPSPPVYAPIFVAA